MSQSRLQDDTLTKSSFPPPYKSLYRQTFEKRMTSAVLHERSPTLAKQLANDLVFFNKHSSPLSSSSSRLSPSLNSLLSFSSSFSSSSTFIPSSSSPPPPSPSISSTPHSLYDTSFSMDSNFNGKRVHRLEDPGVSSTPYATKSKSRKKQEAHIAACTSTAATAVSPNSTYDFPFSDFPFSPLAPTITSPVTRPPVNMAPRPINSNRTKGKPTAAAAPVAAKAAFSVLSDYGDPQPMGNVDVNSPKSKPRTVYSGIKVPSYDEKSETTLDNFLEDEYKRDKHPTKEMLQLFANKISLKNIFTTNGLGKIRKWFDNRRTKDVRENQEEWQEKFDREIRLLSPDNFTGQKQIRKLAKEWGMTNHFVEMNIKQMTGNPKRQLIDTSINQPNLNHPAAEPSSPYTPGGDSANDEQVQPLSATPLFFPAKMPLDPLSSSNSSRAIPNSNSLDHFSIEGMDHILSETPPVFHPSIPSLPVADTDLSLGGIISKISKRPDNVLISFPPSKLKRQNASSHISSSSPEVRTPPALLPQAHPLAISDELNFLHPFRNLHSQLIGAPPASFTNALIEAGTGNELQCFFSKPNRYTPSPLLTTDHSSSDPNNNIDAFLSKLKGESRPPLSHRSLSPSDDVRCLHSPSPQVSTLHSLSHFYTDFSEDEKDNFNSRTIYADNSPCTGATTYMDLQSLSPSPTTNSLATSSYTSAMIFSHQFPSHSPPLTTNSDDSSVLQTFARPNITQEEVLPRNCVTPYGPLTTGTDAQVTVKPKIKSFKFAVGERTYRTISVGELKGFGMSWSEEQWERYYGILESKSGFNPLYHHSLIIACSTHSVKIAIDMYDKLPKEPDSPDPHFSHGKERDLLLFFLLKRDTTNPTLLHYWKRIFDAEKLPYSPTTTSIVEQAEVLFKRYMTNYPEKINPYLQVQLMLDFGRYWLDSATSIKNNKDIHLNLQKSRQWFQRVLQPSFFDIMKDPDTDERIPQLFGTLYTPLLHIEELDIICLLLSNSIPKKIARGSNDAKHVWNGIIDSILNDDNSFTHPTDLFNQQKNFVQTLISLKSLKWALENLYPNCKVDQLVAQNLQLLLHLVEALPEFVKEDATIDSLFRFLDFVKGEDINKHLKSKYLIRVLSLCDLQEKHALLDQLLQWLETNNIQMTPYWQPTLNEIKQNHSRKIRIIWEQVALL